MKKQLLLALLLISATFNLKTVDIDPDLTPLDAQGYWDPAAPAPQPGFSPSNADIAIGLVTLAALAFCSYKYATAKPVDYPRLTWEGYSTMNAQAQAAFDHKQALGCHAIAQSNETVHTVETVACKLYQVKEIAPKSAPQSSFLDKATTLISNNKYTLAAATALTLGAYGAYKLYSYVTQPAKTTSVYDVD